MAPDSEPFLFEVKCQHDHLAASPTDGIGVFAQIYVLQLIGVVVVDGIAQTVTELQLRYQFKEWQVEITAKAHLQKQICLLQLDILLVLTCQIQCRIDTSRDIRSGVVPTLCTELQVDG